jgi:hypothetical protein
MVTGDPAGGGISVVWELAASPPNDGKVNKNIPTLSNFLISPPLVPRQFATCETISPIRIIFSK